MESIVQLPPLFASILSVLLICAVLGILVAVTYIDATTMEIPNGLCVALAGCGLLAVFVIHDISLTSRAIGTLCVSAPLFAIAFFAPGAFGGGDIKLMAAAGFLLGWEGALLAACIGVLIGGAYGLFVLAARKKTAKEHFAFGPALCIGIAIAFLFGTQWVGMLLLLERIVPFV